MEDLQCERILNAKGWILKVRGRYRFQHWVSTIHTPLGKEDLTLVQGFLAATYAAKVIFAVKDHAKV